MTLKEKLEASREAEAALVKRLCEIPGANTWAPDGGDILGRLLEQEGITKELERLVERHI